MELSRIVSFKDWEEWILIKNGLYSANYQEKLDALQVVAMWRVRGKIPHSADSTAQLVECVLNDENFLSISSRSLHSEVSIQLQFSMAVVRAVNGLTDPNKQGLYATSIMLIAEQIGLPGWIVELRHDATHGQIPSLSTLRVAANHLLDWYGTHYWEKQLQFLKQMTVICYPKQYPSTSDLTSQPNGDQSDVTFDEYIQTANFTFFMELLVPVFITSVFVLPALPLDTAVKDDSASLLSRETQRQKRMWYGRLQKMLSVNPSYLHGMLNKLIAAIVDTAKKYLRGVADEAFMGWVLEVAQFWIGTITQALREEYSRLGRHTSKANTQRITQWRSSCEIHKPMMRASAEVLLRSFSERQGLDSGPSAHTFARKASEIASTCQQFYDQFLDANWVQLVVAAPAAEGDALSIGINTGPSPLLSSSSARWARNNSERSLEAGRNADIFPPLQPSSSSNQKMSAEDIADLENFESYLQNLKPRKRSSKVRLEAEEEPDSGAKRRKSEPEKAIPTVDYFEVSSKKDLQPAQCLNMPLWSLGNVPGRLSTQDSLLTFREI